MPLNLLKFTFVASLHALPHPLPWLRRTTTTTAVVSSSRPWVMCSRGGWRISPCAPSAPLAAAHDRLGFRGQKSFNCYSGNKGGGEIIMGQENDNSVSGGKDDQWMERDDPSPTSMLPSDNHRQKPPVLSSPSSFQQQQKQHKQQNQSSKLLTLPTILTLGRVAAVPILVSTFYMNSRLGTTATTSIFIIAAITDWLDGYLARRMKLGSAFGAFLDPVADKLMVAATLVLLCTRPPDVAIFGQFPWILTVPSIAIIGREITMSAVREWAASQNSKLSEAVAVNNLGKWKTAAQMTSLTILLATRDSSFTGAGTVVASGVALLYISAGLAVWSLVVYMKKIWKVLLM